MPLDRATVQILNELNMEDGLEIPMGVSRYHLGNRYRIAECS